MTQPYLRHLKSSKDLETTYAAIRAGFVALALEKNRQATKGPRTLVYNVSVPFLRNRNNVDLILFACRAENLTKDTHKQPSAYIALGELKGGIDPAGADERWKTARTAFQRIHEAFTKHKLKPSTFFIGAAIETNMASEIWKLLRGNILQNTANLTNENQTASITRWLCNL